MYIDIPGLMVAGGSNNITKNGEEDEKEEEEEEEDTEDMEENEEEDEDEKEEPMDTGTSKPSSESKSLSKSPSKKAGMKKKREAGLQEMASPVAKRKKKKATCRFGSQCYQTSARHKEAFDHPSVCNSKYRQYRHTVEIFCIHVDNNYF